MTYVIMSLHEGDKASPIDDYSLYNNVLENTSSAKYWGITVICDTERRQNIIIL